MKGVKLHFSHIKNTSLTPKGNMTTMPSARWPVIAIIVIIRRVFAGNDGNYEGRGSPSLTRLYFSSTNRICKYGNKLTLVYPSF